MNSENRLSRKVKTPRRGIDITKPDVVKVLDFLDEYIYLTTDQLCRLVGGNARYHKDKLRRMWDVGLVARIQPPAVHYPIIYTLDTYGAKVIQEKRELTRWNAQHKRRVNEGAKGYFLCQHTVMANEALIRLLEGARFVNLPRSYSHGVKEKNTYGELRPDKIVKIAGWTIYLEADTGSERREKLQTKALAYARSNQNSFNEDNPTVVLFVVTNQQRVERIKKWIESALQAEGVLILGQLFRIVALEKLDPEALATRPIYRIASLDGRRKLFEPLQVTLHTGFLPGRNDLI